LKIISKILAFTAVLFILSAVPIYAATATEIKLSSATVEDKTITVYGVLTNPVDGVELTMLVGDVKNNDINNIFYFNQSKPTIAADGSFKVSFSINKLLSSDGVYVARFGGTNISKYSQIIITTDDGIATALLGDVDLDGVITSNDAAITLQYVLYSESFLSDKQVSAMYVTDDDTVTANNAANILAKVLNDMYIFPIIDN
jgi:hypothetical protein